MAVHRVHDVLVTRPLGIRLATSRAGSMLRPTFRPGGELECRMLAAQRNETGPARNPLDAIMSPLLGDNRRFRLARPTPLLVRVIYDLTIAESLYNPPPPLRGPPQWRGAGGISGWQATRTHPGAHQSGQ